MKLTPELEYRIIWAIDLLADTIHNNAITKGFYDNTNSDLIRWAATNIPDDLVGKNDFIQHLNKRGERSESEMIALEHSELSEALESIRKNPDAPDKHCPKYLNVDIELADCLIRILDHMAYRCVSPGTIILNKHKFNTTREHKHGKKF